MVILILALSIMVNVGAESIQRRPTVNMGHHKIASAQVWQNAIQRVIAYAQERVLLCLCTKSSDRRLIVCFVIAVLVFCTMNYAHFLFYFSSCIKWFQISILTFILSLLLMGHFLPPKLTTLKLGAVILHESWPTCTSQQTTI